MKKSILLGIAISGAFLIGIFSANPVVDAMAGWKFALDEHARDASAHHDVPETQIYEVSGISVIPELSEEGNIIQLLCLEGDFWDSVSGVAYVTLDPSIDPTNLNIVLQVIETITEINPGIHKGSEKIIGYDLRAAQIGPLQLFDIPVTINGVCLSPSP